MQIKTILAEIDADIARLKQARAILAQDGTVVSEKPVTKKSAKHTMSAAGRKRIAAAQRKRWAALKAGK